MTEQSLDLDRIALDLKDVNLEKINEAVVKKGILSDRSVQEHVQAFRNNIEWYKPFLLEIVEQGHSVLQRFLAILKKAGHSTIVEKLQLNLNIPSHNDADDGLPSLNPSSFSGMKLNDDAIFPTAINFIDDVEPDGLAFSCCTAVEEQDEIDTTDEDITSPIGNVRVKVGKVFYSPLEHDRIYTMGSKPKGYALIIVNQNFPGGIYEYRKGAGRDQLNLIQLFTGLGYVVYDFFNKDSQEMRRIIRKFASLPDHASVDSCVVAVSTHGETGRLVGTDNEYIFMEDVLDEFNNERSPKLRGKPKLFFVQACRGHKFDAGISMSGVADGRMTSFPNKLLQPIQRASSWTDMLIAYSTIPEYVALRNEKHGSWFIMAVTKIFMDHAWNTPISKMFPMVVEVMESFQTSDGEKQVPEISHRGWKKDLYFNPGLYQP